MINPMYNTSCLKKWKFRDRANVVLAKLNEAVLEAIARSRMKIIAWTEITRGTRLMEDGTHFDNPTLYFSSKVR